MERISEHISFKEATRSNTAIKNGIENIPSKKQIKKMKLLADNIFEPLRNWAGVPIYVSSFFRSKKLNSIISKSVSSQHLAEDGSAIDFDGDVFKGKSNSELFNYIKDNLEFDKLIWEYGDDKNPEWVHVSFRRCNNRGIVLRAFSTKKGVKYAKIY